MNCDEARRIVHIGLDRRKEDRDTAAKEARLEKYEQDQIRFCNVHSANAKEQRIYRLAHCGWSCNCFSELPEYKCCVEQLSNQN